MGSENVSKFEVRKSKSKKETRKKSTEERFPDSVEMSFDTDAKNLVRKKKKGKKTFNCSDDGKVFDNTQKRNLNTEDKIPSKRQKTSVLNVEKEKIEFTELQRRNLDDSWTPKTQRYKLSDTEKDFGEDISKSDIKKAKQSLKRWKTSISESAEEFGEPEAGKSEAKKTKQTSKRRKSRLPGSEEDFDEPELEKSEAKKSSKRQKSGLLDPEKDLDEPESSKSDEKKPKQPSKRQLKREKAEKKENEKKEAHRLDAMKKGLNYVSKWKHAKSEWKFEKLRQIWLIENLLDEANIPNDIFPTVLEYFEGCKGMAREQLLKKGMDVIRKMEKKEDEDREEEETESVVYQRARKLLQALPMES